MTAGGRQWPMSGLAGVVALLLLIASGLMFRAAGATDGPAIQWLDRGQLTVRMLHSGARPPEAVSLPLHWDARYPRQPGWGMVELRFDTTAAQRAEPHGLLIERLGNAYSVSLNGHVVTSGGELLRPHDGWAGRKPLWIHLPGPLLQEHNTLTVRLRADFQRRAGLSAVAFGPDSMLKPLWQPMEWRYVTLPRAVSLLHLLVAFFCLLLWWQQRERLFALASLCCMLWSLRIATLWWESVPVDWPTWFRCSFMAFWAGQLAAWLLTGAVWHDRSKRERLAAVAVFALAPAALAVGPNGVVAWVVLLLTAWLVWMLRLAASTLRAPDTARWWMLASLAVAWVAVVRDVAGARLLADQYTQGSWTQGAAVFAAVAVLAIVGQRFTQTRSTLQELTVSLEQRVHDSEARLAEQHAVLLSLEGAQARAEERARILRDMHDGAGAHLISAMRQIESGTATSAQVMQTLQESLDQLRLSVDAMNLPAGDVNALLASLRFRLEPRIVAAGLTLQWDVDPLPLWHAHGDEPMRHLQFLFFEAISNTLQHARATALRLTARAADDHIALELADDGCGLPDVPHGNGLRTMQERAHAIGATLHLTTCPGGVGTCVQIALPLARRDKAARG